MGVLSQLTGFGEADGGVSTKAESPSAAVDRDAHDPRPSDDAVLRTADTQNKAGCVGRHHVLAKTRRLDGRIG